MGSAACEALPGRASTRRYLLQGGDSAFGGTLQSFADPVYPAALLALRLPPVRIVVQLVIGTDGRVQRVLPHSATQLASIPDDAAFMAAIAECTAHWHFAPLAITHVQVAGGRITRNTRTLPFSLVYAFRFAVHDGRPAAGLSRR